MPAPLTLFLAPVPGCRSGTGHIVRAFEETIPEKQH
jgi:hypothetical protein